MNRDKTFGEVVKERRTSRDLTQAELARRVGCATITVRKIESDSMRPSLQIAERLAMSLGVPVSERDIFVRLARSSSTSPQQPSPLPTPRPLLEEIGDEDLSGRAIRGYQLAEKIGAGGYGAVYRAVQPFVERDVAIKIILPQYADQPDFIRRFEAEAQMVARLEHPFIAPLYDYWREPSVAYLVMRLFRGGSLQDVLKQGAIRPEVALSYFYQIGVALDAAHRAGIIHRDIKPANILLDDDNNAYLADFGIAKDLGNLDMDNITREGMILGSPAYLAPEQLRGERVRPQADIYCLGVVLYEMLTGRQPFSGATPVDYMHQQLHQPLPTLSNGASGLPKSLNLVLQRATAKNPENRYPDVPSMLADIQRISWRSGFSGIITPHNIDDADWNSVENPYKGLRSFVESDADTFFGREMLVHTLLGRLGESNDLSRFLAIVGPSGGGKSSVVRAGLIPALRRGGLPGSENWFVEVMIPGSQPLEELEAALLRIAVNPPSSLLTQLSTDERGLLRAVKRILPADPAVELVLVIDQFEELFTLVTSESTRTHFLNSLITAVLDERSRLHVLVTLRADFTDRPLQYVDFGELLQKRTEFILPLSSDEMEAAIAQPVLRLGMTLERGLTAEIIRDVGDEPGTLPLLQYALTELFEQRQDGRLTRAAYAASGGVVVALSRRADVIYASLDPVGQEAVCQLFLRLVTLGEGVEDTRRRVLRSELGAVSAGASLETLLPIDEVVEMYGRFRLLTFDHDPATREPTVEVAHEALLHKWARLRSWLAESRDDIRMQRLLMLAVAEWESAERDPGYLLQGTRFDQFEAWASQSTVALTTVEQEFLDLSRQAREEMQSAEAARLQREIRTAQALAQAEAERADVQKEMSQRLRRRATVLTAALIGTVILVLLSLFFAYRATQERLTAQQQTNLAVSRELAAASTIALDADPERSILLALEALDIAHSVEAETALHRALKTSRVIKTLQGHSDGVNSVAFQPGSLQLATGSEDGTIKLWSADGAIERTLQGHDGGVTAVLFDGDGDTLISTGRDGLVNVWEPDTGAQLLSFDAHERAIVSAALSADGHRLVTTGLDRKTNIWLLPDDPALFEETDVWQLPADKAIAVATISPDGTRVATGNDDMTLTVWQLPTTEDGQIEELFTLDGHTGLVTDLAFSPDGDRLASTSWDATARIWDLTASEPARAAVILTGHTGVVSGVAFSADGSRLATSGLDSKAKVWDLATGLELLNLVGHDGSVMDVAISADGQQLATAGSDFTTRLWDSSPVGNSNSTFAEHEGPVFRLDVSPDGLQAASASWDGTVRVWDTETRQESWAAGHNGRVLGVDFHPDGRQLVTAGEDGQVIVWDLATGKIIWSLAVPGATGNQTVFDGAFDAIFSPDGKQLAIADAAGKIHMWAWPVEAGDERQQILLGHTDMIETIDFSPDGTMLASVSWDRTARLWDLATGETLYTFTDHVGPVEGVSFSPDGKRLATSSGDSTVMIWSVESGEHLMTIAGHASGIPSVIFDPTGTFLATTSSDSSAILWDSRTGERVLTLAGDSDAVLDAAFSPDGRYLFVAGFDTLVTRYLLPLDEVEALAQSRLTRTWTEVECRTLLHEAVCSTGD
ncbi:MAG: protein kinase [Anaerolineae bacterium]|nr:protein kinase [Anaerolineae bacterium]